jgi:ubiquinone/menaquinone biosynthesis C-methylase UbiE
LPSDAFPDNVHPKNGSALDLPEPDGSFDGVLVSMLLHHLIGKSVAESKKNVSRAIAEACRVLKPGGKLVIVESCIPTWFYAFERAVFPVATKLITLFMEHPATLQFPPDMILELLKEYTSEVRMNRIEMGRWVLQYGFKFPAALTPVAPYLFVAHKHDIQGKTAV